MPTKTTPDPQPLADDVAQKIRQLVDQAVLVAVPADSMVQRGTRPDSEYRWLQPTPAAGFEAARKVVALAEQRMYRYVVELRGAGTSWREIADLLEIPWGEGYSRVVRAFELTAGPGSDYSWSGLRVYWHCGDCGQHITDHGPYEGWPADNESGHTEGCCRLAADTAAQERANEEAERRAKVMDEAYQALPAGPAGDFARATVGRARDVIARGGAYRGWSTGESLAVALALNDDAALTRYGQPDRTDAIRRVGAALQPNPEAWLALIRAAATGEG